MPGPTQSDPLEVAKRAENGLLARLDVDAHVRAAAHAGKGAEAAAAAAALQPELTYNVGGAAARTNKLDGSTFAGPFATAKAHAAREVGSLAKGVTVSASAFNRNFQGVQAMQESRRERHEAAWDSYLRDKEANELDSQGS